MLDQSKSLLNNLVFFNNRSPSPIKEVSEGTTFKDKRLIKWILMKYHFITKIFHDGTSISQINNNLSKKRIKIIKKMNKTWIKK